MLDKRPADPVRNGQIKFFVLVLSFCYELLFCFIKTAEHPLSLACLVMISVCVLLQPATCFFVMPVCIFFSSACHFFCVPCCLQWLWISRTFKHLLLLIHWFFQGSYWGAFSSFEVLSSVHSSSLSQRDLILLCSFWILETMRARQG